MASFIAGLTDANVNSTLFTPDYNFLRYNLDKRTQNYQQGLGQLSNAYQSVLNAPLTSEENLKVRDNYVKQAQDALKAASQSDLSLPENQAAAMGVYAPFWEDKDILMDMSFTKQQQSEIQKQQEMQTSGNEADRDTFSTIPLAVMQDRLEKVKAAKRGDFSVYKEPIVRSTPFYNIFKEAETFIKNNTDGWKISKTNVSNGRIETVTNGQGTQKSFVALAKELRGEKYRAQDDMMGRYNTINALKDIKMDQAYKGNVIGDEQAKAFIPEYFSGRQIKMLHHQNAEIDKEMSTIQQKIQDVYNSNNPNHDAIILALSQDLKHYDQAKQENLFQIKTWGNKSSDDYQEMTRNIAYSPSQFFGNLYKEEDIHRAGGLMAENQSVKIEEDKSYWEYNKLQQQAALEHDRLNSEERRKMMELETKGIRGSQTNGGGTGTSSGTGSGGAMYSDINGDGLNDFKEKGVNPSFNTPSVSLSPASVSQKLQPIQTAKNFVYNKRNQTVDETFSILQRNPGILKDYASTEDMGILQTGIFLNGSPRPGFNQKAYDKALKTLSENIEKKYPGAGASVTGPLTAMSAVSDCIIKDITKAIDDAAKYPNNPTLNRTTITMIDAEKALKINQHTLNELWAKEEQFNREVNNFAKDDKYSKIRIKDGNGYTFISPETIAQKYNIPVDIAARYLDGSLELDERKNFGNDSPISGYSAHGAPSPAVSVQTDYYASDDKYNYKLNDLIKDYGKPKDIKKTYDALTTKVNEQLQPTVLKIFTDKDRNMGKVVTYRSGGDQSKEDVANMIANDLLTAGGTKLESTKDGSVANYSDDKTSKQFAEDLLNKVRTSPGDGLASVEYYDISPIHPEKRAIKLNYSSDKILKLFSEDLKKGGKYYNQLDNIQNNGIILELRNDAVVKNLPTSSTVGFYEMLLNDNPNKSPIVNDDLEEKLGIKYKVRKNSADGKVYYQASVKKIEKNSTDPTKYVERWVDARDPSLKEGMKEYEFPAGQDIEEFMKKLQMSASSIYANNAAVVSSILPPPTNNTTFAQRNPDAAKFLADHGIKL